METTEPQAGAPLLGEPLPVELMNTVWAGRDGPHDALENSAGLARWLVAVAPRLPHTGTGVDDGLTASAEHPGLLEEFRRLRDGLRRLAAAATGDPRPYAASATSDLAEAVAAVNRACRYAPAWSRLSWPHDGPPTRSAASSHPPAAVALSAIAEEAVRLFTGEERADLRACQAPGCVLYFVRAHPRREWCSAGCGNRARVARHYQRHRGVGGG